MKREAFFDIIGDVNEDLFTDINDIYIPERRTSWKKWGTIAACICLIAIGIFAYATTPRSVQQLVDRPGFKSSESALAVSDVRIGERIAWYHETGIDPERLEKFLGNLYLEAESATWYYPKNTDTLKYLIRKSPAGTLTLWEFSDFIVVDFADEDSRTHYEKSYPGANLSSYTYREVYEVIYGVDSAADIVSIKASPSTANNTDFGKGIQKQVGTHTYKGQEDIQAFYDITTNVLCYGSAVWQDHIDTSDRFKYSFSTDDPDKLTSGESTWATRYLTVKLADGTTIDNWKYDALRGAFYEFGGIGTQNLPEDDVYTLNAIFGIQ